MVHRPAELASADREDARVCTLRGQHPRSPPRAGEQLHGVFCMESSSSRGGSCFSSIRQLVATRPPSRRRPESHVEFGSVAAFLFPSGEWCPMRPPRCAGALPPWGSQELRPCRRRSNAVLGKFPGMGEESYLPAVESGEKQWTETMDIHESSERGGGQKPPGRGPRHDGCPASSPASLRTSCRCWTESTGEPGSDTSSTSRDAAIG